MVATSFLAGRGIWALIVFFSANYKDLLEYYRIVSAQKNKAVSTDQGSTGTSSSLEESAIELNLALQREIVGFTGLGIRRAVLEADRLEPGNIRKNSSRAFMTVLQTIMASGDYVTFVLNDPEHVESSNQNRGSMLSVMTDSVSSKPSEPIRLSMIQNIPAR